MTYSLDELRDLKRWANANRDGSFDISYWHAVVPEKSSCRTVMCLAGYITIKHGGEPKEICNSQFAWYAIRVQMPGQEDVEQFEDVAARILGLNEHEAGLLFHAEVPSEDGESSDQNEELALDFLNTLIDRAERGLGPMSDIDVEGWREDWEYEHR